MQGMHNRTGILYFVVCYFGLVALSAVGVLFQDQATFIRERDAGKVSFKASDKLVLFCHSVEITVPCVFVCGRWVCVWVYVVLFG